MAYRPTSKLTPEQWSHLSDRVVDGLSVRAASAYALETWGISIAKTSIAANAQIKHAIHTRKSMRQQEAQEIISESLHPIVRGLTDTITDLHRERIATRKEQEGFARTSNEYQILSKQIRQIDMSLKDYTNQYNKILGLNESAFNSQMPELQQKSSTIDEVIAKARSEKRAEGIGQTSSPEKQENLLPLKLIQGGNNEGSESA